MSIYNFKNELADSLQNLSGKTITSSDYSTVGSMLRGFNNLYTCIVTFSKTPSNAAVVLTLDGDVIAAEEDGTYALKEGTYSYVMTADGYVSSGATALVITNADETTGTKTVTKELVKYCVVTFTKTPETLTLVVKDSAVATVTPEEDGTYNLIAASYTYTASADDYTTKTDETLVVSAGDVTTGTKAVTVTLEAAL